MRSAIIHVGVNVSNTHPILMVLPVFKDGSFIFIPIPSDGENMTYSQLRNSLPGACEVIEQLGFPIEGGVHNDPEFIDWTYGEGPRKWMLDELERGDYVFFMGSMKEVSIPSKPEYLHNPRQYQDAISQCLKENRGSNWFYGIFAHFKVSHKYSTGIDMCDEDLFKTNAHVIRGDLEDGGLLTLIKGELSQSLLYKKVIPLSRGNYCLEQFRDILYRHYIKRNIHKPNKWFEAILDEEGTTSLLRLTEGSHRDLK